MDIIKIEEPDNKKKELVKQDIDIVIQRLLTQFPFYGAMALRLDVIPIQDDRCPTAATDFSRIFVNIDFYEKLSEEERKFVLFHEVCHNIMFHNGRKQTRNSEMWNVASDLEIHFIAQNEKLSEPFVIPHDPFWSTLSAEEIYEKLAQKVKKEDSTGKGKGGQESDSNFGNNGKTNSNFGSNSKPFDKHFDGEYGDQESQDRETASKDAVNKISSENGTDENSVKSVHIDSDYAPSISKDAAEKIRRNVIASAQQTERMRGSIPASIKKLIDSWTKPELNWKILLKQFVTKAYGGSRDWLPPARRYISQGLYLQSRRENKINVVVGIDTSGSCYDLQSKFFSELANLLFSFGNFKCTVIQCDAEIQSVEEFDSDNVGKLRNYKWKANGFGGTSFIPVFDEVKNRKINPNVMIYLTDGYGDHPNKPPYPVMWVIPTNGTDECFDFGQIVRLKDTMI